ncbi:UNVERIFIED_CONTAM: hypothetical protein Sradi_6855000 [Sesamum radiatum]|uniref:Uncharacterized protein n=1 Tax=Sesamum radiatum TaxID=300843 RepID=A0AAW2JKN4_SESRA
MGDPGWTNHEVADKCAHVVADVEPSQENCGSGKEVSNVAELQTTHLVNNFDSTAPGFEQSRPNKGKEIIAYNSFQALDTDRGDLGENWVHTIGSKSTGPRSSPTAKPP